MSEVVPALQLLRPILIGIMAVKTYCKINSCYFSAHTAQWLTQTKTQPFLVVYGLTSTPTLLPVLTMPARVPLPAS